MNVIGLFLLLFTVVAVVMGLYLIAGSATTTPSDSFGNQPSERTNLSVGNTTHIMDAGTSVMPWIAVIVAVLTLIGVFMWALGKKTGNNSSRYH